MITVNGSKIIIAETQTSKGIVPAQEIDLSPFQGQTVRVYLDNNLKLVVNPMYDCYWHLCEMELPHPQADTIIDEESGEEIRFEPKPLDLDKIDIRHFDLPKEA